MNNKIQRINAFENTFGNFVPVQSNKEYTHCILEKEVLEGLLRENRDLNNTLSKSKEKNKSLITENKRLNDELTKYTQFFKEHKEELVAKQKKWDQLIQEQNDNYKTIDKVIEVCRERANKDRKIKDKKHSIGYVVLSSEQYNYHISRTNTVLLWKTVMELPFFVELQQEEMINLYCEDKKREEFFDKINIGGYDNDIDLRVADPTSEDPCYIDIYFKKNYKTGFWEASIIHLKEVLL